jgi:hypothetical protein
VVHEQAAAFALDALDAVEQAEFEAHLRVCPGCEDDLDRLRTTAAALAFAADLPVPRAALRLHVLGAGRVLVLRRRWVAPVLSAGAIAAACAAIVVGLYGWTGGRATVGGLTAYPVTGARGALLVASSGEAVLAVRGLPAPAAGTTYQLWVVRLDTPVAAGFLRGGVARLTRRVPPGASVAVSVEPVGGSRRPTGPLLIKAAAA